MVSKPRVCIYIFYIWRNFGGTLEARRGEFWNTTLRWSMGHTSTIGGVSPHPGIKWPKKQCVKHTCHVFSQLLPPRRHVGVCGPTTSHQCRRPPTITLGHLSLASKPPTVVFKGICVKNLPFSFFLGFLPVLISPTTIATGDLAWEIVKSN